MSSTYTKLLLSRLNAFGAAPQQLLAENRREYLDQCRSKDASFQEISYQKLFQNLGVLSPTNPYALLRVVLKEAGMMYPAKTALTVVTFQPPNHPLFLNDLLDPDAKKHLFPSLPDSHRMVLDETLLLGGLLLIAPLGWVLKPVTRELSEDDIFDHFQKDEWPFYVGPTATFHTHETSYQFGLHDLTHYRSWFGLPLESRQDALFISRFLKDFFLRHPIARKNYENGMRAVGIEATDHLKALVRLLMQFAQMTIANHENGSALARSFLDEFSDYIQGHPRQSSWERALSVAPILVSDYMENRKPGTNFLNSVSLS